MSIFKVIEGIVSTRPTSPLGNFVSDSTQAAAADVLFDFGGLRKDIHIENDQPVVVKFDSAASTGMSIPSGSWDWTGQYAKSMFVTFTVPTNFKVMANG